MSDNTSTSRLVMPSAASSVGTGLRTAPPGDRRVHAAQRFAAARREVVKSVAVEDGERLSQPRLGLPPARLACGGGNQQTDDRLPEPALHARQPRIRLGEQHLTAARFALSAGCDRVRGERHHAADRGVGGQ